MKSIAFSFFLLVCISCTVNKPIELILEPRIEENYSVADSTEKLILTDQALTIRPYNVVISIIEYIPYCGGAAPSDDEFNRNFPFTDQLIAINKESGVKSDLWINGGLHYIQLEPGKYLIKEKFKDVPLMDFIQSHLNNGMYYLNDSDQCYENWKNTNLFEFEIFHADTVVHLNTSVGSLCFTGNNPCLLYTGPYPP